MTQASGEQRNRGWAPQWIVFLMFLIFLMLLLIQSGIALGASPDEAINETFENFSIGPIDGQGNWTSVVPTGRPNSIAEVVSLPTHSGSRSLHLSGFVSNATYTINNPVPTNSTVTVSFWYREQYGFGTNDTGNNMSLRNAIILSDGYNQHTTYLNICHAGTGHRSVLMTANPIGNGSCVNGVGDMTEGNWYFIEIEYDFENQTAHARVDRGDWGSNINLRVYGGSNGSYITSFTLMSMWDNPPQFWFDDFGQVGDGTATFPEPPYQVPYTYNGETYDYIIQIHYGQPSYHYDRIVYGKTSELEIKRPYIEKWGLNSPTLRVNYAALVPPDTSCSGDDPIIGPSYSSNNDGATWTALTNGGWCSEGGFYYQQILPTMLRSNIDIKHKGNWIYNSGAYSDCTTFPLFCWMGAKYDGDVVIPASAFGGGETSTGASATINQITPLNGGFSISGASQTGEVSSIVKFGIEVRDDNGATVTYEATPNEDGTFSKVIEGLTNGLRYFVKVFTVDAAQTQGPASAPVSVIPQAAPQDAKEWGRNLPPILLLHGWRSNGETWKSVKKELLDIEANVSAPTFQAATSALDNDNLCAEATELPSLIDQIRYGKSKVIVIAHSQGGIVARAYMQFGARPDVFIDNFTAGDALGGHFARCRDEFDVRSPIFRGDIAKLITYGTPHKGADKCPLNLCSLYPLLAPGNQLLALLNNFYLFPLPEDVSIVNLVGRLSSSSSDDCLISTTSQDMRNFGYPADVHIIDGVRHFDSKPCAGYFDRKKKTETQDSLNIFKHVLGAPEYVVRALSPVDLIVVDPEYRTISKDKREIWGAIYEEQTDDSGHTTDVIRIPFPVSGNYQITVVPDPGAAPTETFSIETELSGVTTRLVENMPIQNIPEQPFAVAVDITPDPFSFVDQTGVALNRVINSNVITVSGINQPAAINILGGEYSVNGAAYTRVSGLVNNGDKVSVRHTSAATYDTATDTVLSIGGYSDVFTSTTMPECVSTPELTVALTPNRLWPPNHKMVTITANVQASDTCDPNPTVTLVSITSNEPDNGLGDGDTPNDIQNAAFGADDRTFELRAERSGTGTGRVYTITYQATNSAGKTSTATAQAVVPHDQGK